MSFLIIILLTDVHRKLHNNLYLKSTQSINQKGEMMKLISTKFHFLLIALFTLIFQAGMVAQGITTAAINGTVTDQIGDPLPAASIIIEHMPSGTQYGTTSRNDGKFNMLGLRTGGPFTITVSYVGYSTQILQNQFLELGQTLKIDFILPETAVELLDVTIIAEKNPILSEGRTGASTNVSRDQIDKLPTISRSFEDYYKLSPLFSGGSAAGRNSKYNNIQIDGSNYNDLFGLGGSTPGSQSRVTPISLDAIEEFQITVSPYDIRQGGFTGAGINAITRSGTNFYRGSGFYYGRNESLVGKSPDTLKSKLAEFTDYQAGFRVGGPIIENKLFFFANGEITRYKQPLERTFGNQKFSTNAFTVSLDSLNLLSNFLKNTYGYDPGGWDMMNFERKSDKIFTRFDYNMGKNHKLTARWNYLNASDDNTPSRGRGLTDIYADNGRYLINNTTNSIALQLTSLFSNNLSNELTIGYVRQVDEPTYKGNPFPTLYISTADTSKIDIGNQTLVLGAEQFRHQNILEQDVFELTNNLSYFTGEHTFTVGVKLELFKFRNLFIPGNFGVYRYNSIADFINNVRPASYEYRYSATSNPTQDANWGANQIGFYLQDEWAVSQRFRLTAGVRFDVPIYPDVPNFNARIDTFFVQQRGMDVGTNKAVKTTVNISPRVGFNWAMDDDRITQIRGGVGVFSGRFPAVWVSNQYSNTGVDFYTNTTAPTGFIGDPYNQFTGGVTTLPTAEVNLTDQNFKAPAILRSNLAMDHTLPYNFILSLEAIYSVTQNDVFFQNINLAGQQENGGLTSGGKIAGEDREVWGTYSASGRRFTANRVSSAFTGVYLLTNTSQGENANLIIQLQRLATTDGFYGNLAYTWGISKDVNSGVSAQARSSWRFNPTQGDPNKPVLTFSVNDRRHRILAALSYTYDWGVQGLKTNFGMFYNGYSGRPFSYFVAGDVNGDGESDNDLIYIPRDVNDIILVNSTGTELPKTDEAYAKLFAYIENDDYLSENKGSMSERNGAREPWTHQIDLRISQQVATFRGHSIEFTFDILNVLNLLDSESGWVNQVANQNISPLTFHSLETTPGSNYGKPRYRLNNTSDPAAPLNIESRWQAQFGIRYTF